MQISLSYFILKTFFEETSEEEIKNFSLKKSTNKYERSQRLNRESIMVKNFCLLWPADQMWHELLCISFASVSHFLMNTANSSRKITF